MINRGDRRCISPREQRGISGPAHVMGRAWRWTRDTLFDEYCVLVR